MRGMRSVSKIITNPNGHTSNAVGALFAFALLGAVVGFIIAMAG